MKVKVLEIFWPTLEYYGLRFDAKIKNKNSDSRFDTANYISSPAEMQFDLDWRVVIHH